MGNRQAAAELRGGLVPPLWLWCALHLLIAALATWGLRRYALHRRLLDHPGERRSHTVATPRGGGMAIVVALLTGCLVASFVWPTGRLSIAWFAAGLLLVAGVGWWDDHRPLSAKLRFAIHALASVSLGLLVVRHTGQPLDGILTALASVVLINVWNFMDGINGLASSQAALAGAAFALVVPGNLSWAGWALTAACLGFLPFNFPRAHLPGRWRQRSTRLCAGRAPGLVGGGGAGELVDRVVPVDCISCRRGLHAAVSHAFRTALVGASRLARLSTPGTIADQSCAGDHGLLRFQSHRCLLVCHNSYRFARVAHG